MRKSFLWIFFAVAALLAAQAVFAASLFAAKTSDKDETRIFFTVESGKTVSDMGRDLEAAGIIKSSLAFKVFARLFKKNVQAGDFELSSAMSVREIFQTLSLGKRRQIRVKIPEGLTSRQIAALLQEKNVVSHDEFLAAIRDKDFLQKFKIPADSAEGYLFPDTYFFDEGMDAGEVVRILAENFFKSAKEAGISADGGQDLQNIVILASIVEKEYCDEEEAPLIAGVFLNRLQKRMRLESCATIVYVITEELGKPHPQRIFYSDLDAESAFNTYRNYGLPPAPISNPGKTALFAAKNPQKSEFLFFRLTDSEQGRHTFSKTLAEHDKAASFRVKAAK